MRLDTLEPRGERKEGLGDGRPGTAGLVNHLAEVRKHSRTATCTLDSFEATFASQSQGHYHTICCLEPAMP